MDFKTFLDKSLSYQDYRKEISKLLEDGKTSGDYQSSEMTEFTRINVSRMNKWDKVRLTLARSASKYAFLVFDSSTSLILIFNFLLIRHYVNKRQISFILNEKLAQ